MNLQWPGCPHLVAYRMNALTVWIVKLLYGVDQKYANLVNILLDREIIPEFIQERCRSDLIAGKICELLDDHAVREEQLKFTENALSTLRPESGLPSDAAASVVVSLLDALHQPDSEKR